MNPSSYTEETLVQKPTVDYLERQLGWETVYACNSEDFGPDSLLGRASEREAVLTRKLREKLVELNPGLPDGAYDDAMRQITAIAASQGIISANRDEKDGATVPFYYEGRGEKLQVEVDDLKRKMYFAMCFAPIPVCHRRCMRVCGRRGDCAARLMCRKWPVEPGGEEAGGFALAAGTLPGARSD